MNYGLLILWMFPILAGIIAFLIGTRKPAGVSDTSESPNNPGTSDNLETPDNLSISDNLETSGNPNTSGNPGILEKNRNDWIDIAMFVQFVLLICMGVELAKGWKMEFAADSAMGVGFYLLMDKVRLMMCAVATIVFAVVSQFMKWSLTGMKGTNRFYLCYMGIFGCVIGAIMSVTFLNLLMFLIAAYILLLPMLLQRQEPESIKNSKFYTVFTALAYTLITIGVLIIVAKVGAAGFAFLYYRTSEYMVSSVVRFGGIIAMVGFAIFAGMFPLQFQVTRSTSGSLLEVSVLVSAVLSKNAVLGLFLMARALFASNKTVGEVLLVWSLLTIIWGLILTLTSTDIRKMLSGLNIASNAVIAMASSVALLGGAEASITLRSVIYLTIASVLSLMTLYMVALELVRKKKTYEIKGLIASGKEHKLLMVAAFLACASLAGIPGTMGFLGYGILVKSIYAIVKWKWLIVVCVIQWGFYITAVSRVFMKLFVSKKEETVRVLASQEELDASAKNVEPADPKNVYRFGEVCLLVLGIIQVLVGSLPFLTVSHINAEIDEYFGNLTPLDSMVFYTRESLCMFAIAAVLGLFFYVNLVHGILLRNTKEKKDRKMKKDMKIED